MSIDDKHPFSLELQCGDVPEKNKSSFYASY